MNNLEQPIKPEKKEKESFYGETSIRNVDIRVGLYGKKYQAKFRQIEEQRPMALARLNEKGLSLLEEKAEEKRIRLAKAVLDISDEEDVNAEALAREVYEEAKRIVEEIGEEMDKSLPGGSPPSRVSSIGVSLKLQEYIDLLKSTEKKE